MAPWWRKKEKEKENTKQPISAPSANGNTMTTTAIAGGTLGTINSINTVGTTPWQHNFTVGAPAVNIGQNYSIGTGYGGFTVGSMQPTNILVVSNAGNEIVRVDVNGKVTWADHINVDEAAKALAQSIRIGAELQAGITKSVKANMRDTVFEEIIEIAKKNGSLTLDELTYMYESSKIMEKLKGGRE
jgi:hypothetical protein